MPPRQPPKLLLRVFLQFRSGITQQLVRASHARVEGAGDAPYLNFNVYSVAPRLIPTSPVASR
jgi:hypothetical protein